MLPQFGYIVAQAGADSHPQKNQASSSNLNNSSQLTKPYLPPQQQDNYYYTRHTSPSMLPPPPPPPLPYMYSSTPPSATMTPREEYNRYYSDNSSSSYRPLQPLPPPPPPPPPSSNKNWQDMEPYHPPPPPSAWQDHHRWQQEPIELNENKMLRRIRESNDLMNQMDTEFWEQCDEVYREKLQSLQQEIQMIQSGTHSLFRQSLADIESIREQTIQHADDFKQYALVLHRTQYEQEISVATEEYENEKHNLHDIVLQAIEEKKKLVREDKEETFDTKELFRDAYSRIHTKRNLRKRTPFDRHSSASPSRQERRRRDRQATPHNIHAAPSTLEEEELESEFILMKGGNPAKRQTSFQQQKR